MNQTEFVVSRFENRSGTVSWRVSGWLAGLRIRKNLKSREEAAAEKAVLEIKALQAASGLRAVATPLTAEQVREAEALFQRVAGKARSLSFYVDFALSNFREPNEQKQLVDAIAEYVAAKEHEFEQDQISRPQICRIRWDLKRLNARFAGETVASLTAPQIVEFLERGRPSMKTYNNRRGIVSTFLKYSFQRGWLAENLAPKVPYHRIRRRKGVAQTLAVTQASSFMEQLELFEGGRWIPYYAICLFAGIRPGVPDGEISKLKPDALRLDNDTIFISAEVSKVREPRRVTIQPNLKAWLLAYPLQEFRIVVGDFQKRRARFAKKFNLSHDVTRHTFISMYVAKFRSVGEAALQAGNSESIIRKHYLDLKTAEEAEQFFNILPKHRTVPPLTKIPQTSGPALRIAV